MKSFSINPERRISEEDFIKYNSNELMEGIAELGFQEIRRYEKNIRRTVYYIVNEYVRIFRLEKCLGRGGKILLNLSDIALGLIIYLVTVCLDAGTTGKAEIFSFEVNIFLAIVIFALLTLFFFAVRLYAK